LVFFVCPPQLFSLALIPTLAAGNHACSAIRVLCVSLLFLFSLQLTELLCSPPPLPLSSQPPLVLLPFFTFDVFDYGEASLSMRRSDLMGFSFARSPFPFPAFPHWVTMWMNHNLIRRLSPLPPTFVFPPPIRRYLPHFCFFFRSAVATRKRSCQERVLCIGLCPQRSVL